MLVTVPLVGLLSIKIPMPGLSNDQSYIQMFTDKSFGSVGKYMEKSDPLEALKTAKLHEL
jgi:hypothetical protein